MRTKLDIAIAGAGPAGLAAALYLKRGGHAVTIFERFNEAKPVGSGLILQPTGLTVLHDLGLLPDILALGARIDRLHGSDARSGRTVLDVRYDARHGGRFGLAVHRATLFGVLAKAVRDAGIAIETGADLQDIDTSSTGAVLIDTVGRRIGPFDLVVDATGTRSPLRRRCPGSSDPIPLAYGAFWASLEWRGDGFEENALSQRYQRATVMIGVLPIGRVENSGSRMAAFFWSLKPAESEAVRAQGLQAWKDRIVHLWPETVPYLAQIDSFEQLSLARYGHHTLAQPAGRRLAIIGDAAHSTSPQLGQGANMALLDTCALAYALDTQANIDAALEAYGASRRRHVRVFQALSWMFTPFYQSDSILLPFIRNRVVATVARVPPAPQFLASMVAGTTVDPFKRTGLKEVDWSHLDSTG